MKNWYKSKTLWVNVLVIPVVVAEYLLTKQIYSPEAHVLALAIINVVLRIVTTTGLTK